MRKRLAGLGGALAMIAALAVGCADPGVPTALESGSGPRQSQSVAPRQRVKVLRRTIPLEPSVNKNQVEFHVDHFSGDLLSVP